MHLGMHEKLAITLKSFFLEFHLVKVFIELYATYSHQLKYAP
jgi:hypothetical protein